MEQSSVGALVRDGNSEVRAAVGKRSAGYGSIHAKGVDSPTRLSAVKQIDQKRLAKGAMWGAPSGLMEVGSVGCSLVTSGRLTNIGTSRRAVGHQFAAWNKLLLDILMS